MASEDTELLGTLNYFMLEGYFRRVQSTVAEANKRLGFDPVLTLYKGLSLLNESQPQDCIREVSSVKDKSVVDVAKYVLLIQAHKRCKNVDKERVGQLDARLKEIRRKSSDVQIYFAAVAYWHVGNYKHALEYADRLVKNNENFKQGIILKAWIEITAAKEPYNKDTAKKYINSIKKSGKAFDQGLVENKDPFGLIGRARCLIRAKKFSPAMESTNQVIVSFPDFVPAHAERMRCYLALLNWDQMLDSANRLLNMTTQYPEALILVTMHTITQAGDYNVAVDKLSELNQAIDRFEPMNSKLYYDCGKLFATLAGKNMHILKLTSSMISHAMSIEPKVKYNIELAKQLFLMGKYKEADGEYRRCMELDETSVSSMLGSLYCQLHMKHNLQDMNDQLEFLNEVAKNDNIESELCLLRAMHGRLSGSDSMAMVDLLERCTKLHFTSTTQLHMSTNYMQAFDISFCMMLVNELFNHVPSQPLNSGETPSTALKCCDQILTTINKIAPGIHQALFYRAKTLFISGDMDSAGLILDKCLETDVTYAPAHLLKADIHLQKGNLSMVGKYLDTALSYNFQIREHPKYHLLKSRTSLHAGNEHEAITTLKMAMNLPGVRTRHEKAPVEGGDRLDIFLLLVHALLKNEQIHEAAKVMQDALNSFRGTPEEVRVQIANSELSVKRGDIESALSTLRTIKPNQPYYVQAKQKMAAIFLQYRKDKQLFTSCYRELHDKNPSIHTAMLLGDAYMKVNQPNDAVKVYENALRKNPKDGELAKKIGQVLTTTHDFKKAITYYETAIKNGQKWLRFELAHLLIKLKNYSKAERVLQAETANEEEDQRSQLDKNISEARRLVLLATLYRDTQRPQEEMQALNRAREVQARVLKRAQIEQPDKVEKEKVQAGQLCCQLANYCKQVENNLHNSIKYLKEALVYTPKDTKILLDLARIELQAGNTENCQQYCHQVLKITDDSNDQASMMLADVMFNKKEYRQAIFHYEKLLESKPDHYEAMARLIGLLRRGGRLKDVESFLQSAEDRCGKAKCEMQAGFQYCKGIYNWYCGRAGEALKLLNRSRMDSEWSEKALEIMIRICLNPDQQTLGGEVFESLQQQSNSERPETNTALSTAERLVKEFQSNEDPFKAEVLQNLVLAASKSKPSAERALNNFVEIGQKKRDYVPALLGMAIAYQMIKQTPKARNQLKRISKMQWSHEDAEYFEAAWLLLSDLYISAGKYDVATDLLKKCLEHNKSCCKAYEYLGFIYEKEQSYKDAASHYETAWQYSGQNNPVIGYKLAFNYLKAKKHIEAINVSNKVLKIYPDYPKMKKEILEKARLSLRT